jgi:biopolymer transport protein ExbD
MNKKSLLGKKKKKKPSDFALQITSMADIFMILLVFLLKSYATSITNIAPSAHISLPEIDQAQGIPKDSLKIEVGKDGVIIDDQQVLTLQNYQFNTDEQGPGETSPTITKILNAERKKTPDANNDSALVVMADEGTPYSTIKRVVASAAGAGFVDLQLLVVQAQ